MKKFIAFIPARRGSKRIRKKNFIRIKGLPLYKHTLNAAKKSKETSMWKAIESLKDKNSDISLSAGNTGALLVISRLLLETISGISKPALAALWPNKNIMNVVLDLGANIECN